MRARPVKGIEHFEMAAGVVQQLLRGDVQENRDHRAALDSLRQVVGQ